jgi:hypothetical protein
MADMKALWGPTRMKNLLELRAGERSFGNERAAIIASTNEARAKRAFEAQQNALDRDLEREGNKGGGPSGGNDYDLWDNPGKLQRPEYKEASLAARAYLKGRSVDDWQALADEVEKAKGIDWSQRERAQWIKKFSKRYKPRR